MLIWLRSWMLRLSILMPVFSVVLAFLYYWNVLLYPGEHVSKEYVSRLLTQDSPVYYRDGETVMDSVSYDHHRYYVPYDELPSEWKNAIVAMEDKTFWSHYGVEPVLILKAVYRNLRGTFSGGSTLTQQTAKNLYNRDQFQQERVTVLKKIIKGGEDPKMRRAIGFSARVWAKLWEALNAMRLESVFSKEEILEFYANQFHVEGTGRGIGIASRYFFNKLPAELTLQECAFIAAIVKGPSNYNPFIKQTEEARMDTLKKATGRYQEVLNQMLAAGYITQGQRDEIYMKEIPFNRGFFRYKHTTLNDVLKKELDSPPIQKALADADIDNLSTAGVHIVTTVDQEVQKRSEYAMRRHLTRLSAKLKDMTSKAPLKRPSGFLPSLNRTPQAYEFYEGIITKTKIKRKRLHQLTIDLGGHTCIVDRKSLKNLDDMMGVSSKELIRRLPEQGRVLVSMRDSNTCDIELDGVLQGGLLATDKGAIVAVVGGRRNLYLNRALASKVQLGSAWKPVIFAAAIQMGWSPTDMLDNYHNAFVFSNSWWFPGASHSWSPPTINMLWTGAYSENRASAWLLYHLSDRLPEEKLKELAISLNLFPAADETPKEYKKRLNSEEMGAIIPSRSWTQTVAFQRAKREVLQVMPEGEEKTNIFSLHHAHPVILRNGYKQVRESRQSYKHNVAALSFNIKEVTEAMKSCQAPYSELLSENQKNETSIDILFGLFSGFNEKKIPKGLWWNSEKERIECGRGSGDPLTWEIIASYQLQESITELPPFWIDGKISM
ncbi:MAG: transglycosylase domain-containing protein, partial [Myxococcota bacterium]|nr:transglycosylase domain-containing protein [Myxococcota bacterium]